MLTVSFYCFLNCVFYSASKDRQFICYFKETCFTFQKDGSNFQHLFQIFHYSLMINSVIGNTDYASNS